MRHASRLAFTALFWLLGLPVFTGALCAQSPVGFEETFALAPDREAALAQLVPGSEEHFYYRCLLYQHQGKLAEADTLLQQWREALGDSDRRRQLLCRQILLLYSADPEKSLTRLKDELGLRFDHERENAAGADTTPSTLAPDALDFGKLAAKYLAQDPGLSRFNDSALPRLAALNPDARLKHEILKRLQLPILPDLARWVAEDLDAHPERGFGDYMVHRQLTQEQLDELAALRPALLRNTNYVGACLVRLRPRDGAAQLEASPAERMAYLERLQAFAERLAPAFDGLKALVLYHRLLEDRTRGTYDRARFLAYLRLPKAAGYVNPDFRAKSGGRQSLGDMNSSWGSQLALLGAGDDEPLVRDYLARFLEDADTPAEFAEFIESGYLQKLWAETRLLAGKGDPQRLTAVLTPVVADALKERVDLEFLPVNPRTFGAADPVKLSLAVKNIKTLLVKVYAVDLLAFRRAGTAAAFERNADLEGILPTAERSFTYEEPPVRRVVRSYDFPELSGRGLYVVDFIGNGRSVRALVQKGRLTALTEPAADGQHVTVLDESGRIVKDAGLWMENRLYRSAADGTIVLPYSERPGTKNVAFLAGESVSLGTLDHLAENYRLDAGFHVEREALLAGKTATVAVRPVLTINGKPIGLDCLESPVLVVATGDLDRAQSVREVPNFALKGELEPVYAFQVPERLTSITFTLKAKVRPAQGGEPRDLSSTASFPLNGIDATDATEALFLSLAEGGYAVDLLGKSGEARVGRAVMVQLTHRDFKETLDFLLRTDANGRVRLGKLPGVTAVQAQAEPVQRSWTLPTDRYLLESPVVRPAGAPVRIPGAAADGPPPFLLERGDRGVALHDRSAALGREDGFLVLKDLPAGAYELYLPDDGRVIGVRLAPPEGAEGRLRDGDRRWDAATPEPLQVIRLDAGAEAVRIQLANWTAGTRVHVAASRFLPDHDLFADLTPFAFPGPASALVGVPLSDYTGGRALDDEMRYILERQRAPRLPGNTLPRPGLLLNPWAVEKTETGVQAGMAGEGYGAGAAGGWAGASRGDAGTKLSVALPGGYESLEFLRNPGVFLANLRPDANGVVTVPRKDLGDAQLVRVLAVDERRSACRVFPFPETPAAFRDLCLAEGLDPAKRFTEQKAVRPLAAGESVAIADLTSAKLVLVDDLDRAYRLFSAVSPDGALGEFAFLPRWDKMSEAERAEAYGRCASHELHLFLYFKDRPWFDRVVRPYLKNKLTKTFIDKFLLEEDLAAYRRPFAFERLNTLEKAFLAVRVPEERKAVADWIRKHLESNPPSVDELVLRFDTALGIEGLDAGDRLGLEEAREAAEDQISGMPEAGISADQITVASSAPLASEEADESSRDGYFAKKEKAAMQPSAPRPAPAAMKARRMDAPAAFRQVERTRELAESDYYRLAPAAESPGRVRPNRFWLDFVLHEGGDGFRSPHVLEAPGSLTETLAALAVLDVPFKAEKPETKAEGTAFTLKAASPALAVVREIREAGESKPAGASILATQRFFRPDEDTVMINGEPQEKYVEGEFLPRVVYGCRVVLTNPGGLRKRLDVLLQVPRGAVPVSAGRVTRSVPVLLDPYATRQLMYFFYFPKPGEFAHYPAQVSAGGVPLAACEAKPLHVVETPSVIDKTSWSYISQDAPPEDVLRYLGEENLNGVRLGRIAWRVKDAAFYRAALDVLTRRHVYDADLFSYGVRHKDVPAIREFLLHRPDFRDRLGPFLQSPLLDLDPAAIGAYRHLEYEPLVNARAHTFGKQRTIPNDRLSAQYQAFLNLLAFRPTLTDADRLEAAYYLLLQDRIPEGRDLFAKVDAGKLATRLQYDYCAAWLAFFTDTPATARALAQGYKSHPVKRWAERFGDVLAQLDEMEGRAGAAAPDRNDRNRRQEALASTEPSLELKVEGRKIVLEHRNVPEIRLGFHPTDAEVLFSRDPFGGATAGQAAVVRAKETRVVKPAPGATRTVVDLPPGLQNADVVVSAEGGGVTRTTPCHGGALTVQVVEAFGQVKVTREAGGRPVSKAYVKVYARWKDGSVNFYKDGYTDLRGRFDYASLSTDDLDRTDRFAILVLSDTDGAVVKEAAPPGR
ncbi:MAG: hypothetical protein KA419_09345 [Acidobacteria bacterium]|nr:hypothetical protein [Acidobacteriota bacterium]